MSSMPESSKSESSKSDTSKSESSTPKSEQKYQLTNINSTKQFEEILKSNDYVIVKFTAPWCGPCRQISPKYKSLATEFTNLKFTVIDIDLMEVEEVLLKYKISGIPDFISFVRGEKKDRFSGASSQQLTKMVSSLEKERKEQ